MARATTIKIKTLKIISRAAIRVITATITKV
jgi:hypothetical protein